MARGIKKNPVIEIVSTPLEEYIPIKVVLVGSKNWLTSQFSAEAIHNTEQLPIRCTEDLEPVRRWMESQTNRYIDTETRGLDKRSGLNPNSKGSEILLVQIGNREIVYILQPELIVEFKDLLEEYNVTHVFQNGVFDWKYLYAKYNIHINKIYDTMLGEQLLTSGRLGLLVNLAAIARRRPPHRIITKTVRKEFVDFKGTFTWDMVYYAAKDVVLLPDIMASQLADLKRLSMMTVAEDEFRLIPVTGSMELGGVPFSDKTLRLALIYWRKRQDDLEREILKLYDERVSAKGTHSKFLLPDMKFEFDVNSQSQKLAALRELGFEIEDVKRDTLEELDDPIAKLLGQYSEALKVNSTYGENLIQRLDPITRRLQVEFNQLGHGDIEASAGKATTIATGRYSSDFQQLPRARTLYQKVEDQELRIVEATFANEIELIKRRQNEREQT